VRGFEISGRPKFQGFTVNSESLGLHRNPDVAIGTEGQFVVVWEDINNIGDFDIKITGYYADGAEEFEESTVHSVTAGEARCGHGGRRFVYRSLGR